LIQFVQINCTIHLWSKYPAKYNTEQSSNVIGSSSLISTLFKNGDVNNDNDDGVVDDNVDGVGKDDDDDDSGSWGGDSTTKLTCSCN